MSNMDDIYGNLDNYNDVNALEELRIENKDLKFKLDEYASTIDKMQKDFDKLALDYKKLEINYSSLLITAKAEVERKTQIISNLNIEKDTIILNALKNSNKSILNIRRNMARDRANSFKNIKKDNESGKDTKNARDITESHKREKERERNSDNRLASVDTASSGNTNERTKVPNIQNMPEKMDTFSDNNNDGKENVVHAKFRAQSLRNRRKSVPVLGKQFAKFSSDEEFEGNYSNEEAPKKEWPPRNDTSRRPFDRKYMEKQIHKVSETSGIDEKYSSYHESSRESYYKGRFNRFDRYRARDKSSQRYRRHFSPDRLHRKGPRDHSGENYQRPEYGRPRLLESPPPDRYDTHRNRERRSNYERETDKRERDNSYDERFRYHSDRLSMKHKTQSDYDEPSNKRVRTDSYTKHVEGDKWLVKEDYQVEGQITSKTIDNLQHTSCQSPDFNFGDTLPTVPVKEIMNTADTQLEDPRLQSKKYIVKTEDNKVVLSTISGRDVNLKVVDKSSWDIERVNIPDALLRPPNYDDEYINEMYMNIDNPTSNISMESGEIHSETNDSPLLNSVTETFFSDYDKYNQRNITKDLFDVPEKQMESLTTRDYPSKKLPAKYKIPRVNSDRITSSQTASNDKQTPLGLLLNEFNPVEKKDDKLKSFDSDLASRTETVSFSGNFQENKTKCDIQSKIKETGQSIEPKPLSARIMVEGDLELSDETSDFVDNLNSKSKTKAKEPKSDSFSKRKNRKSVTDVDKGKKCQEINLTKTSKGDVVGCSLEVKRLVSEANGDESLPDTSKKQKTKRKSQKPKGAAAKETIKTNEDEKILDRKTRSKKEKDTKLKDIKPKFTELFGESSSLITPEDLGIAYAEAQPAINNKYVPIFEDAQDANDVNVEVTKKVDTISSVNDVAPNDKVKEEAKTNVEVTKKVDTVSSIHVVATNDKVKEDAKTTKTSNVSLETKKKPLKKIEEARTGTTEKEKVVNNEANIYENLNSETMTKESDVVKTVIISTGVQPQSAIESYTDNPVHIEPVVDNTEIAQNIVLSRIQEDSIQALATSTPHKSLLTVHVDTERMPDSSCNSSECKSRHDVSVDQISTSNETESQTGADAPDVRIFVRRRRKVVKKSN